MHFPIVVGAVLAASLSTAQAADGCTKIGGNHYCNKVKSVTYNNFGSSGSYMDVTSFDGSTCSQESRSFSGPLAPMNEEHSMHLRGPAHLKQFAVYTPGLAPSKREAVPASKPSFHQRRHGHGHAHSKRAGSDWRKVVSPGSEQENSPSLEKKPVSGESNSALQGKAGPGGWGRQAYYNAEQAIADGLVFLNHHGGDGSGVFDMDLGNSLSYASSDGMSGSSSSQVLENKMLPDNEEIVIMSDKECNGDCGTVRPGTVAYHGFSGDSKFYLVELEMPMTGKTGWNEDMPALWALNAKIPRTLQYGKPECSCWKSGCGELDILEILDSGNNRAKTTFHGDIAGGDSDWIERPADGAIKLGVLFNADTRSTHITVLDSDTEFSETLGLDDIVKIVVDAVEGALQSVFTFGG